MIKLSNFIAAHQHYVEQKITFRLLQDQAAILIGLCESPYVSVSNPIEITQIVIEWLLLQPEATQNYDAFLGGDVYVCETESDLLQIHGCDFEWAEKHGGQWPNVTDMATSWDVCAYLNEANDNPEWVIFLFSWNNAGGHIYYVPKALWLQARVIEHIEATT